MLLRMKNNLTIKNLRNHSPETVEELRSLLNRGASASPDPRHKNFYELESDSRVFYIHVSPRTGNVMFLAVWDTGLRQAAVNLLELTACTSPG
jgi:hypothetical protein